MKKDVVQHARALHHVGSFAREVARSSSSSSSALAASMPRAVLHPLAASRVSDARWRCTHGAIIAVQVKGGGPPFIKTCIRNAASDEEAGMPLSRTGLAAPPPRVRHLRSMPCAPHEQTCAEHACHAHRAHAKPTTCPFSALVHSHAHATKAGGSCHWPLAGCRPARRRRIQHRDAVCIPLPSPAGCAPPASCTRGACHSPS